MSSAFVKIGYGKNVRTSLRGNPTKALFNHCGDGAIEQR